MQDRPTRTELLQALEDFLRIDLMPKLEGASSFHVRVAANVTAIVRRELELAPELEAGEARRLEQLLACSEDLGAMNRELCRRLRSGEMALDHPGLEEHLIQTTLGKLEVDNPRYASLAEARSAWPSLIPGPLLGDTDS